MPQNNSREALDRRNAKKRADRLRAKEATARKRAQGRLRQQRYTANKKKKTVAQNENRIVATLENGISISVSAKPSTGQRADGVSIWVSTKPSTGERADEPQPTTVVLQKPEAPGLAADGVSTEPSSDERADDRPPQKKKPKRSVAELQSTNRNGGKGLATADPNYSRRLGKKEVPILFVDSHALAAGQQPLPPAFNLKRPAVFTTNNALKEAAATIRDNVETVLSNKGATNGKVFKRDPVDVGETEGMYAKAVLQDAFVNDVLASFLPEGIVVKKTTEQAVAFVNLEESPPCGLHNDGFIGFLLCLTGEVTIIMAENNPAKHLTNVGGSSSQFAEKPFDFDKGRRDKEQWFLYTLQPGEGIVIPDGWVHSVKGSKGSVRVSLKIDLHLHAVPE